MVRRAIVEGGDNYAGIAGQLAGTSMFTAAVLVSALKPATVDQPLFGNSDGASGWLIERLTDPAPGVAAYRVTVYEAVALVATAVLVVPQYATKLTLIQLAYDQATGLAVYVNGNLAAALVPTAGAFIPGADVPTIHMTQAEDSTFFQSMGYDELTSPVTPEHAMALAGSVTNIADDLSPALEHAYSATFGNRFGTAEVWNDAGTSASPINLTRIGGAEGGALSVLPRYN